MAHRARRGRWPLARWQISESGWERRGKRGCSVLFRHPGLVGQCQDWCGALSLVLVGHRLGPVI